MSEAFSIRRQFAFSIQLLGFDINWTILFVSPRCSSIFQNVMCLFTPFSKVNYTVIRIRRWSMVKSSFWDRNCFTKWRTFTLLIINHGCYYRPAFYIVWKHVIIVLEISIVFIRCSNTWRSWNSISTRVKTSICIFIMSWSYFFLNWGHRWYRCQGFKICLDSNFSRINNRQ